jgi:DNA-binding SARP family transcriptional activator
MANFKVRLFGKFSVQRDGATIEGIEARKVQELFSYLLLSRNRSQSREVICEELWGDRPPSKSKKYLRQALWRLQLALRDANHPDKSEVVADVDWIQINPSEDLWLDIAEFEQRFSSLNDKDAHELTLRDFSSIQFATELYQGNLLEGWYQDWCLFERERFQIMYLMLLDKLIQYCEIHGHYSVGLFYGTEILRYDHAYERAHRQMMRLYSMAGDRTQALHQYQRCATALQKELDIEPSEPTKQLYEQIRSDTFSAASAMDNALVQTTPDSAQSISRMLNRLERFSDELNQMRFQLKEEFAALGDT